MSFGNNVRKFDVPYIFNPTGCISVAARELLNDEDKAYLRELCAGASFVVNVGTFTGASSEAMLEGMGESGACLSIDTFRGTEGAADTNMSPVLAMGCYLTRIERFSLRGQTLIADSVSAAKMLRPGIADVVFIDAAHNYASVKEDILAWREIVRPGGVLCGHDYDRVIDEAPEGWLEVVGDYEETTDNLHPGVYRAVRELCPGFTLASDTNSSIWMVRV